MPQLKDFRVLSYTVPANGTVDIRASGNYIVALAATGAFQIGRDNEPAFSFQAGLKINLPEGEQFDALRIVDASGAPNTVELAIGFGDFDDNRLTVSGALNLTKASSLTTVADVSCATASATQVIAANSTRRRVVVQNLDIAATLRVGDSNVTAARGLRVGPGESLVLFATEAVFVRNDSGAAVDVAVLEEAD